MDKTVFIEIGWILNRAWVSTGAFVCVCLAPRYHGVGKLFLDSHSSSLILISMYQIKSNQIKSTIEKSSSLFFRGGVSYYQFAI
jgi:hypothetical protein